MDDETKALARANLALIQEKDPAAATFIRMMADAQTAAKLLGKDVPRLIEMHNAGQADEAFLEALAMLVVIHERMSDIAHNHKAGLAANLREITKRAEGNGLKAAVLATVAVLTPPNETRH